MFQNSWRQLRIPLSEVGSAGIIVFFSRYFTFRQVADASRLFNYVRHWMEDFPYWARSGGRLLARLALKRLDPGGNVCTATENRKRDG